MTIYTDQQWANKKAYLYIIVRDAAAGNPNPATSDLFLGLQSIAVVVHDNVSDKDPVDVAVTENKNIMFAFRTKQNL